MRQHRLAARAAIAAASIVTLLAGAIAASPLEQRELAGLSPEMQAEVRARAGGGNPVTEGLQVLLLNTPQDPA
jgi:hypothetical protein